MNDIEQILAKQFEGGLFIDTSLITIGKEYHFRKDYYTVLNGIVYTFIGDGSELYATGDKLLSIDTDCIRIGKYDKTKKYNHTNKSIPYKEFLKLIKL